jgi:hypothetical protein
MRMSLMKSKILVLVLVLIAVVLGVWLLQQRDTD